MREIFEDFIFAIRKGIFGSHDERKIDFSAVESLAASHGMSAVFCIFAREAYKEEYGDRLKREYDLLTYKHLRQRTEYESLASRLEASGIDYLPVKGIELMKLYPSEMMREMSDIDILVRKEDLSSVKDILCASGYTYEHKGHHDVYVKDKSICFEVHETLIDKQRDTGIDDYFSDPWSMSTHDGHRYEMSPENTYVYLMSHLYGHFHQGGIGVRTVLDTYLYEKKHSLDFDAIESVLGKYGLDGFAKNVRSLCRVWFEGADADELSDELGEYIISSGKHGSISNVSMDLASQGDGKLKNTWKIIKRKVFLDKNEMKKRYPFAEHTILLPAAYIARLFDIVTRRGEESYTWLGKIANNDSEKIAEHKAQMKRFGVN